MCRNAKFVAIGHTATKISRFFDFQDGGRPPSWILKRLKFEQLLECAGSICVMCQILWLSLKLLPRYHKFSVSICRPADSLDLFCANLDQYEQHLCSLSLCKNFVGIGVIVCELCLKILIHAPQIGFLGDLTPYETYINETPRGTSLHEKTS